MSSAGERTVNGKRELTEGLAAQILDHIRGGVPVGTHLTAQELAERFSVSRFPVGQALQLLAAKGVLTHQRNRGYFVSDVKDVVAGEPRPCRPGTMPPTSISGWPTITFMAACPILPPKPS